MLLELTTRCNENCSHCFVDARPDGQHMSFEVLDKVIAFIKLVKPYSLVVTGGEITTDPDFDTKIRKLVQELKPYKTLILLESNGTWIHNKEMCERMKAILAIPTIYSMQISSHRTYYPNYKMIAQAEKDGLFKKISSKINVYVDWQGVDTNLSYLGRGTQVITEDEVKGKPMCSNIFCVGKQIEQLCQETRQEVSFHTLLTILELRMGKMCTPSIGITGDIHVGETMFCSKLGNVNHPNMDDDTFQYELLLRLKKMKMCDKCKARKNVPSHILQALNL